MHDAFSSRTPTPELRARLWCDARGAVAGASPEALALLGLEASELIGGSLFRHVHGFAPYLARLLGERRWLELGHDTIWSGADFVQRSGAPLRCLVRVRRARADGLAGAAFELGLEVQAGRPAAGHRTPSRATHA